MSPFIIFTFHRGLKIRILRHRNWTSPTRTTIRHVYFGTFTQVTRSDSKRERRMTHGAAFRTVFRAKKRHNEAFEVPCVCFNVFPEVFSRQLPFKLYDKAFGAIKCQCLSKYLCLIWNGFGLFGLTMFLGRKSCQQMIYDLQVCVNNENKMKNFERLLPQVVGFELFLTNGKPSRSKH